MPSSPTSTACQVAPLSASRELPVRGPRASSSSPVPDDKSSGQQRCKRVRDQPVRGFLQRARHLGGAVKSRRLVSSPDIRPDESLLPLLVKEHIELDREF